MPCGGWISVPSSPTKCTQTDCLLQWYASIAEEDDSNRDCGCSGRLWRHYEAYCLWSRCSVLLWSPVQTDTEGLSFVWTNILKFGALRFSLPSVQQLRPSGIWSRVICWIDRDILGGTRHVTAGLNRCTKDMCSNITVRYFIFWYFPDLSSQYIYLNINQFDALNFIMIISRLYMFRAHLLIVRRSKFYYTASGIVTPIGGRPVHRLREDLCTAQPPIGVMLPEAV